MIISFNLSTDELDAIAAYLSRCPEDDPAMTACGKLMISVLSEAETRRMDADTMATALGKHYERPCIAEVDG